MIPGRGRGPAGRRLPVRFAHRRAVLLPVGALRHRGRGLPRRRLVRPRVRVTHLGRRRRTAAPAFRGGGLLRHRLGERGRGRLPRGRTHTLQRRHHARARGEQRGGGAGGGPAFLALRGRGLAATGRGTPTTRRRGPPRGRAARRRGDRRGLLLEANLRLLETGGETGGYSLVFGHGEGRAFLLLAADGSSLTHDAPKSAPPVRLPVPAFDPRAYHRLLLRVRDGRAEAWLDGAHVARGLRVPSPSGVGLCTRRTQAAAFDGIALTLPT